MEIKRHSKNILFLMPNQIVVDSSRGRKDFKNLDKLVESINTHGLIHPCVVAKTEVEGKFVLIAGERRYRAMCILGWDKLPCTDRDDLSSIEKKEIELEENLQRESLSWEEEIELYRQIDEIKRELHGSKMQGDSKGKGWTGKDTAESLGISKSNLYRQIQFAKFLKIHPEYKKDIERLPLSAAIKKVEMAVLANKNKQLFEQGFITVNADLRLGNCINLIKEVPDNSIDLLLTDVPYGILDVSEVLDGKKGHPSAGYKGLISESDNLSKESIVNILETLLPELRRVLKPSSHFYIFHSFTIYHELYSLLVQRDFLPFDVPIIWNKGHPTNAFLGYEYMACYEPILYGHVPPKAKRFILGGSLIVDFQPSEKKSRLHPFQKPEDLLSYLIRQSTNIGDTILDPFAGSGSTLVVAKKLNRSCIGFEINPKNYHLALEQLKEENKNVS